MISRIRLLASHAPVILCRRFGPIPSTNCKSAGLFSIMDKTSAPNRSTRRLAKIGPTPFTIPLPRYFSMPSGVVGATVRSVVALSWRPYSLSRNQAPSAVIHSPGLTDGSVPTTVTTSRCLEAFTRRTQKPESSLKYVTRSMSPSTRSALVAWRQQLLTHKRHSRTRGR